MALTALPGPLFAQSVWTGAIDNDWFKAGNWAPAILPTGPTWINSDTPGPVIDGGPAVSLTGLTVVARDLGTTGSLVIRNAGSLAAEQGIIGFFPGSTGTVAVDAAALTFDTSLKVGGGARGTLTILGGGTVTTGTYLTIADQDIATGLVTVDGMGSTLAVGGALEVGWAGKGTLEIHNGGVATSGAGRIASGEGSLGVVTVDGAGSRWSSSAMITIGTFGSGIVTVRNGGSISAAGGIAVAVDAQATGRLNIGAAAGDAPAAPGAVDAATIQFGAGDGRLIFNHTSSAYSFAPVVAGDGRIEQIAGTTILTGDSAAFTGPTRVHGGQLIVNGSLAGSNVTVTGGVLSGTGTVGSLGIHPGGTVAPGNASIGTLTVGNFGQAPNSIYQVELASNGTGDRINVGGIAELVNGAVLQAVQADGGPYVLGTRYTVLTANGGISGTYVLAGDTQLTAFLGFAAAYDPSNVYIDVLQNRPFTAAAQTANQLGAAGGLGTLPASGALASAVLNLPNDAAARFAFDQLSGEIHASTKSVLLSDSQFVRDAVFGRLRSSAAGGSASGLGSGSGTAMAEAACDATTTCAGLNDVTFWTRAFGSWGQWNSDGNAATLWRNTGGFFVGGDMPVMEAGRIGLLFGYSRSGVQVSDRNSFGTSDNYHLGLYGGSQWGDLAFRAGFAYTWHTLSTTRSIAFSGFSDTARGNYSAGTAQVFGELGYGLRWEKASFEPFANVAYVGVQTGGFGETGGAAALTSWGSYADATFTTLGLRASTDFAVGGVDATAKASAGWRHAFGDTTPGSTFAFAGGGAFNVLGVPIAQNSAVVEAGLDVRLAPNASLGVSYGGQFGSGALDQSVRGSFSIRF
ncbi:MAG: autotransporter domain-containing protein [Rhodospirillales bacterium]|nr:autotransporter domain-containing protein [Rhodospirillales bacterium]